MIHYWWIQKKWQIVDPSGPLNYTSTQFCLLAKWDIRSTRESHRSISRKWDIVNKLVEIPHGDKSTVHRVARVRGHKEDRQRAVISLQSFFVCSDIVFTNTAAVTLYHSRLVTLTHFPLPQGHRNVKIWWGLARNLIPGDFQFFCWCMLILILSSVCFLMRHPQVLMSLFVSVALCPASASFNYALSVT